MAKTMKQKGLVKVPRGTKVCWLAKEDRNGWAVGLAVGKKNLWLRGLRFANRQEAERICQKSAIVFIHTKDSKELPDKLRKHFTGKKRK